MNSFSLFRALFRRKKLDAEMAEEMRAHLERRTQVNLAAGMSSDEARYAAQRQFGGVEQLKEIAREQRSGRWLEELMVDGRFAFRMLRKHPGFTLSAVLTLALGTGFVTTLFTMINGVAFGDLPFEEATRIVSIDVPPAQFADYAARQHSCEALALAQSTSANLRAGNFVSRYPAAIVSVNFLAVLRARPILGRGFQADDSLAGASRTALIGYSVWEREFERSPGAIGRELQINGEVHTIVGVMPAGFGFPLNQEVWTPHRRGEPFPGYGFVFGRLRPDVSARQAATEFTGIALGLAPASVGTPAATASIQVVPFAERFVKPALRIMLSAIMAATILVLLLACANVANLVLARAVDRRKELAVRAAMGAGRGRLIRQMLTETFLVVALGAGGGLAIATWTTRALWTYMMKERPLTGGAPFWMNFDVDGRVYGFVVAVAFLASLLTGLMPALQASRIDLTGALKNGAGSGLRTTRFSGTLINVQMAFSVCLVTVAGLFVTVLLAFNQKTLPYDPKSVMTARVSLEERRYDDVGARRRFFEELASRLSVTPGIEGVALNSSESLRLPRNPRIEFEGTAYPRAEDRPTLVMETVSTDFVAGYGVGLLAGRTFLRSDDAAAPAVAVVNAVFATRFGEGRDIVGRRFRLAGGSSTAESWITVVGVVPDLGSMKAGEDSRGPAIYRPIAQTDDRAMTILVRLRGDVSRAAGAIRSEVAALDAELPVARLQTVQEILEFERIGMNAFGTLFIVCGVGALVLASVGIYGVIAFAVKMRTREFGVRMALGADRGTIMRMVFGQGARQVSVGLGAGALLAVGASAVLSSMFQGFGRSSFDLWIYATVMLLLAGVSSAALLVPARRAALVDPMVALRAE